MADKDEITIEFEGRTVRGSEAPKGKPRHDSGHGGGCGPVALVGE